MGPVSIPLWALALVLAGMLAFLTFAPVQWVNSDAPPISMGAK